MKKYTLMISILIAMIALIIGGKLVYPKVQSMSKEEKFEDKVVALSKFEQEKIRKIELVNNEKVILVQKNNIWQEPDKEDLVYNQDLVGDMVNQIAKLSAIRVISNVQDYSYYGITPDASKITVYSKDNAMESYTVGAQTPAKDAYYITRSTDSQIYCVPKTEINQIFVPRSVLVESKMELPSIEKVETVSVTNLDRTVVSLQRKIDKNNKDAWILKDVYKSDFNASADKVQSYMNTLYDLTLEAFVTDDSTKLEAYGLTAPSTQIRINADFYMNIGKKDNGFVYVKVSGLPGIYTMREEKLLNLLKVNPFELLDRQVFNRPIEQVKQITFIAADKREYVLDIMQDEVTGRYVGKLQGLLLENENLESLYSQITNLRISQTLSNPTMEIKQERDSELSIEYLMLDGTSIKLELIPYDPSYYILRYNNDIEFAMEKKQFVELFNTLNLYLNNNE